MNKSYFKENNDINYYSVSGTQYKQVINFLNHEPSNFSNTKTFRAIPSAYNRYYKRIT